jgi:hypothetical protein
MKVFQIGVCKGNDDLTELIKNKDIELLVLVEPNSFHNDDIEKCYENIKNKHIENIVINNDSNKKEVSFYLHENDGPLFEVASLEKWHILKHGYHEQGIIEYKIQSLTINQLFDKYQVKDIDILFIDAEGFDDSIIKSIDFSKYNIKNIYYENLHLKSNVEDFLENYNYKIVYKVGQNGWMNLAEFK